MNKKYLITAGITTSLLILCLYKRDKPDLPKILSQSPFVKYAPLIDNSYRLGFMDLDIELPPTELTVIGHVPDWLEGTFFRNGPAKFTHNSSWVTNWFDGLAMIHSFSCHNKTIQYQNKFLRTGDYLSVLATGNMSYFGFLQDPCKHLFKNIMSLFIPESFKSPQLNNANINCARFNNKLVALTETPLPIAFDAQTLQTTGVFNYNDTLPKTNIHDTAHPHYDPDKKEHIAFLTTYGLTSFHHIYRIKDGQSARETIAKIATKEPSYMHSFSITKNYAILIALPLVCPALPINLLLRTRAFIKNFAWKPDLGTTFIIVDRNNNKLLATLTGEPFFAFHTINAFEQDNSIILDMVTYPDNRVIQQAEFNILLAPQGQHTITYAAAYATRFTLDLDSKRITGKQLFKYPIELPRINYQHYNTHNYKYIYAFGPDTFAYVGNKLYKINITTSKALVWQEANCYPSEPVFVPKPLGTQEDDGVILSVVLDTQKACSFLLILDARTFKELARAYTPHHIPFGIHGQFLT